VAGSQTSTSFKSPSAFVAGRPDTTQVSATATDTRALRLCGDSGCHGDECEARGDDLAADDNGTYAVGASITFTASFTDAGRRHAHVFDQLGRRHDQHRGGQRNVGRLGRCGTNHIYKYNGKYTITVTITTRNGGVGTATAISTSSAGSPPPDDFVEYDLLKPEVHRRRQELRAKKAAKVKKRSGPRLRRGSHHIRRRPRALRGASWVQATRASGPALHVLAERVESAPAPE